MLGLEVVRGGELGVLVRQRWLHSVRREVVRHGVGRCVRIAHGKKA
jgi:hypothetical protein